MLINIFLYVVKHTQKTHYCTVHELDGSTYRAVLSKAHDMNALRNELREEVHFLLHPEDYSYLGDECDGNCSGCSEMYECHGLI